MYPVDLHMHTIVSTHVYNTLHDYITETERKGVKFSAITDHGPDMVDASYYWHSVSMRIWPCLVDGMGILRGAESNIKNIEGGIDCSGPMLTSLDLIIAGFHEPVLPPQDRDTHAQTTIVVMASSEVYTISHLGNSKFPVDTPAITEAVARYRMALGINNSSSISSRMGSEDNCRAIAVAARDAGGQVVLGSDSHTALALGEFTECRKILDVVDFPKKRALDISPRHLLNFLKSRGMPTIPEFADF